MFLAGRILELQNEGGNPLTTKVIGPFIRRLHDIF